MNSEDWIYFQDCFSAYRDRCGILSTYMKKHEVTYSLAIEEHEGGYLAYFPALPGCHTWGKLRIPIRPLLP